MNKIIEGKVVKRPEKTRKLDRKMRMALSVVS
jgi:hypothetical protein